LSKVTKSFRIEEALWNQFAATCKALNRRITDVIEELFRDFLNEKGPNIQMNESDALRKYQKLRLELKKMGKMFDKDFGRDTFKTLREHYRELGGKDDLSNFNEIRALMFQNPPDVPKEALLYFWDYARKYKSFLELGNRLAELGKGNLPTSTEGEIEETEVESNESKTEEC